MRKFKYSLRLILVVLVFTLALGTTFFTAYADEDIDTLEEDEAIEMLEPEANYDETEGIPVFIPVKAKIMEILSTEVKEIEYSGGVIKTKLQIVEAKITQGDHKNEVVRIEHETNAFNAAYNFTVKKGDGVLLYLEEYEDGSIRSANISDLVRDKYLVYLLAAFILVLLIVGRGKGIKAIVSLALTCLAVVKVLLPMILRGYNPVLASVGVCTVVIILTLIIVSGYNKKTLSAVIGTTGGVIVAGLMALIVGYAAKLTGLGGEEAQMLMYIPQNIQFDFRGLLFAGIMMGAMGATMDVGMSIASAMHEIKTATPHINTRDLIRAGMNVGRDVMGTMSNTLILAYAGGSLHLMLLFMAYDIPFVDIINRDAIASEVVRALAGSVGLIFTIPLTAMAAGFIGGYEKRNASKSVNGGF